MTQKKTDIALLPNRSLAADDEELRQLQHDRFEDQAQQTLLDGLPHNTFRAYSHDFAVYRQWCESQHPRLVALPTTESALMGFLTSVDKKKDGKYPCRGGTIERRISGIVWAHALANIPSPVTPRISKLLHAIKVRRASEGEKPPRMAAPLTLGDLRKITRWIDAHPSALSTRNRAIVLVGWVCAMRRSEISALLREDIGKITDKGFALTIRRSKADQLGLGQDLPVTTEDDASLCPVEAMRGWLSVRGDADGPLFWRSGWRKHDEPLPISDKQISRIVLKLVKEAGLKPEGRDMDFSAHSLRAGFITEAVRAGQHDRQVMERSRHKTHEVFLRYVRIAQNIDQNAASGFSKWGGK